MKSFWSGVDAAVVTFVSVAPSVPFSTVALIVNVAVAPLPNVPMLHKPVALS